VGLRGGVICFATPAKQTPEPFESCDRYSNHRNEWTSHCRREDEESEKEHGWDYEGNDSEALDPFMARCERYKAECEANARKY